MTPSASGPERQILLHEWNAVIPSKSEGLLAHQMLEFRANQAPEAPAIYQGATLVTYRELDQKANRLAHFLQVRGVGPGGRVAILLERSVMLFEAVFAVQKAGGTYLPLDPATPPERLASILKEANAHMVLTDSLHASLLPLAISRLELDNQTVLLAGMPSHTPACEIGPAHISRVFFTSGSMGIPKAVLWPHSRQIPGGSWSEKTFQLTSKDRFLLKSSLAFTPINLEIFLPIGIGASVVIAPPNSEYDMALVAQLIIKEKITILNIVPTLLQLLLKTETFKGGKSLRHVICFGEALAPELEAEFFKQSSASLTVVYGSTEAPSSTFRHCDPHRPTTGVNIGKRTGNKQVLILNKALDLAPIGATGEICIGGDHLALGYLNDPVLTALKFIPNPFSNLPGARLYRTGDLGRHHPDGSLEFMGRMDTQVKIRGVRVELGEVEAVLKRHPYLRNAAVVDRDAASGEKILVAYLEKTNPLQLDSIRQFARERLSGAMMPARFVLMDTLPLTPIGKIDRKALPDPFTTDTWAATEGTEPKSPEELRIAQVWSEVLDVGAVDVEESFFNMGGHSLLGARLAMLLSEEFNTEFTASHLLEFSSIARQAEFLQQTAPSGNSSRCLLKIQAGGTSHPPLFFVPGGKGGDEELLGYARFLKGIGGSWPVLAFRARGANGVDAPHASVKSMAADYLKELRKEQPRGPYFLMGECIGGNIVYEMAQQLTGLGETVAFLGLFDTTPAAPSKFSASVWKQLRKRLRECRKKISEASPKNRKRVAGQQVRRFARFLGDQFGFMKDNPLPNDPKQRISHKKRVRNVYPTALLRYLPRSYAGDVHFFASDEGEQHRLAEAWRPLIQGVFALQRLPGDHTQYLVSNPRESANQVRGMLDSALAASTQNTLGLQSPSFSG